MDSRFRGNDVWLWICRTIQMTPLPTAQVASGRLLFYYVSVLRARGAKGTKKSQALRADRATREIESASRVWKGEHGLHQTRVGLFVFREGFPAWRH